MNPAIDLEAEVGSVTPDVKLRCAEPTIDAGGGGVNVARALNRMTGKATALFPEGAGLGSFFRSLVEEEGVDCKTFPIDQAMYRINTHFRETDEQRQYRFCVPGPKLEENDWQRALDLLSDVLGEGDILVTSGSLSPGVPTDFNARTAKVAEDAQASFVLDAPGDTLKTLKQTPVSWITPNKKEFEDLLGHEVSNQQLETELASFVANYAFENILLTLGPEGAIYAGKEGYESIPSPEVEKLSSVGAGDSAVAGLALGLACDEDHLRSCQRAVAAGAAAVMTPGTKLLEESDFKALFERVKNARSESSQ